MLLIILLLDLCWAALFTSLGYSAKPTISTLKVDSSNLAANYDYIQSVIQNASFIAIDAEFGGTLRVF